MLHLLNKYQGQSNAHKYWYNDLEIIFLLYWFHWKETSKIHNRSQLEMNDENVPSGMFMFPPSPWYPRLLAYRFRQKSNNLQKNKVKETND